jgi:hypothetical protein
MRSLFLRVIFAPFRLRGRSKLTFTLLFRELLQRGHSVERRIAICLLDEFPKQLNEAEFQSGLIVFPARN